MKNKGISLIEMIITIVILGLTIPVLLNMWSDVALRSARSEALADALFYGQQLMEEIQSKKFDQHTAAPWSDTLGPDNAETRLGTGNAGFNDVDDYNGYSDSPAPGYSRCVTVDYVALSGTAWNGTCSPNTPSGCTPASCTAGNVTDYKRITVRVDRNDSLVKDIVLALVVNPF